MASHPDLKLALLTIGCLLAVWGPTFAAIAIGVTRGLRSAGAAEPGAKVSPAARQ